MAAPKEQWGTRIGVIMAVAASAVGIGNFLRFPGQAAANGGGTFMIPYFCALLLLGIPVCWAEWTMGKYGGQLGYHSCPAILGWLGGHRAWRYVGVMGLLMPTIVYMYYVVLESWCLAYAGSYLVGAVNLGDDPTAYVQKSGEYFTTLVGADIDGVMLKGSIHPSVWFWAFTFVANFALIYRGISRGIELFCNIAMPIMALCAIAVLVRVLTLPPMTDAAGTTRSVLDGLGFMWNPKAAGGQAWYTGLLDAKIWLAAAGQIFFTLSVGFGVIMTYASYLKPKQDVLLSGLTASATNEFFEVCLGGLITVPAAFLFLGAAGVGGTFGLGFNTLPVVFEYMPAGRFFGFVWFFMLFLAAITSSISLLQPVIAFLEEALGIGRRASVTILGAMTAAGSLFVIYFSKNLAALDTLDFWSAQVGIFVFGTIEIILLGWVFGARRGYQVALDGTELRPPPWIFTVVMRFVTPAYLLFVFVMWCYGDAPTYLKSLSKGGVPLLAVLVMAATLIFFLVLIQAGERRWDRGAPRGVDIPPEDNS
jgi:neurotransmitter:Na+ symporter, NSS family